MKKTLLFLIILVSLYIAFSGDARTSLIDWAKHDEWKRQQLQELVDAVHKDGSARYVLMSVRVYDKNRDGIIDDKEVVKIEEILEAEKPL